MSHQWLLTAVSVQILELHTVNGAIHLFGHILPVVRVANCDPCVQNVIGMVCHSGPSEPGAIHLV